MSLSSQPDTDYQWPVHALGKESKRRILCDESQFRIYHETLLQDEQHSRFYQFPNDAFVFILKGQAYLSDNQAGLALEQYQGSWISPDQAHKLVLLSPHLELLIIAYQGNLAPCAQALYLESQTIESKLITSNQIERQMLSQVESLSIELENYPGKQTEHLHYHRQSGQFIITLEGEMGLSVNHAEVTIEPYDWALVKAKQRHFLKNNQAESSLCLSIYSPPPAKDRVLVLKKND